MRFSRGFRGKSSFGKTRWTMCQIFSVLAKLTPILFVLFCRSGLYKQLSLSSDERARLMVWEDGSGGGSASDHAM